MQIKVLSWNIWYGKYLDKILQYLKQQDPDIICLQEIIKAEGEEKNTAQIIAEELGLNVVYDYALRKELDGKTIDWGSAILCKYKIKNSKTFELPGSERRIAIKAIVDLDEKQLNIFTTHIVHSHQKDTPEQMVQADEIAKIVTKESTILTGDFNATPKSYLVKKIGEVLKNTNNEELPTWSMYPKDCPVRCTEEGLNQRLDYIFVSSDVKVENFYVGESKGSDHLPVIAKISL